MSRDSDLEKWIYQEHTRVKHKILEGYLGGWLSILGPAHGRLCYFDCFAGRGEYVGEIPGSPVIAMRVANNLIAKNRLKEVVCFFIERDQDNYESLGKVVERNRETFPLVKVCCKLGEFASHISDVITQVGDRLAPSFFFIDPFGFTGVSYILIRDILSLPRTEVFLTFMYRDINRFLSSDNVESSFDELFGTQEWRKISTLRIRHKDGKMLCANSIYNSFAK